MLYQVKTKVSPNLSIVWKLINIHKFNTLPIILDLHVITLNPTTTNFLYLELSELQSDNLVSFE